METSPTQKAYMRGYYRGSKGAWPDHRPPLPPDTTIAAIIRCARALRDAVDGQLAMSCGEDDERESLFGPKIDAFDEAMKECGRWVREGESKTSRQEAAIQRLLDAGYTAEDLEAAADKFAALKEGRTIPPDAAKAGIYLVHWKSGGASLASIGCDESGARWLAPTNWLHPGKLQDHFNDIAMLEKLEVA